MKTPAVPMLFALCLLVNLQAQNLHTRVRAIGEDYKSFQFAAVIQASDTLLSGGFSLSTADSIEIFRLRGLAAYALSDMAEALQSFRSLLSVNRKYVLNPAENPPKVISFFEQIRSGLPPGSSAKTESLPEFDTLVWNSHLAYSILLPGLGHVTREPDTKGWALLAGSILTLGSSVYYTLKTSDDRDAYLSATEKSLIEERYKTYNSSYRTRNILYISYAALWLFAQSDLLFFSPRPEPDSAHALMAFSDLNGRISFSLQIRL